VEVCSLDDVGQGYDLAQLEEGCVAYTLGRHTNDYMISFYSHSPSGFFVECGWGGHVIDPETWRRMRPMTGRVYGARAALHGARATRPVTREAPLRRGARRASARGHPGLPLARRGHRGERSIDQ
jgi:hypothetical protein